MTHALTTIAIANQKGGVAKTTTVASLGGALVRHGKEVLLVDLDAQANLTLSLGLEPAKLRAVVSEAFFNAASLFSLSRPTSVASLDLVPSNAEMEIAERFLPLRKNHETLLRRAISLRHPPEGGHESNRPREQEGETVGANPVVAYSGPYDYIIFDCPPVMGAVTINAMAAANLLIIPTQPEYFSAHALRTMLTFVRQVRNQHNPQLAYRILITMHDQRNRIHRQINQQIRRAFGAGVLNTQISVDTRLRESALRGLPITHHKQTSRSAQQYDALAEELIEYVQS